MIKHDNNLKFTFLISFLLLIGQFAMLVHAEKHPFHDSQESCKVFIAAEQSDSMLIVDAIHLPVVNNFLPYFHLIVSAPVVSPNFYQARAPPFFS